jgi:predicted Fe-S protein YdhL (DUF1289 family)
MPQVYQPAMSAYAFTAESLRIAYHRECMNPLPPDPLASPCVRNCCLDEDNVCMGCGRSLQEIVAWGTSSDGEKAATLERSRARLQSRGATFRVSPRH